MAKQSKNIKTKAQAESKDEAEPRHYYEAVGRRKTSIARARITALSKKGITAFIVNNKLLEEYFPRGEYSKIAKAPIYTANQDGVFSISVRVSGGGTHSQAEAVRHGVARALLLADNSHRKELKRAGFLKRDPRAKERRKFGLKKARKAPQWAKR